jgi:hypothetical protein
MSGSLKEIDAVIQALERKLELMRSARSLLVAESGGLPASATSPRALDATANPVSANKGRKVGEPATWALSLPEVFADGKARTIGELVEDLNKLGQNVNVPQVYSWMQRAVKRSEFTHRRRKYAPKGTSKE